MIPVSINRPPFDTVNTSKEMAWVFEQLKEVERASQEADVGEIADQFTITGYTPPFVPTYALNLSTATATDVANVVATFLIALKKRGTKRKF